MLKLKQFWRSKSSPPATKKPTGPERGPPRPTPGRFPWPCRPCPLSMASNLRPRQTPSRPNQARPGPWLTVPSPKKIQASYRGEAQGIKVQSAQAPNRATTTPRSTNIPRVKLPPPARILVPFLFSRPKGGSKWFKVFDTWRGKVWLAEKHVLKLKIGCCRLIGWFPRSKGSSGLPTN